MGTRNLTAAIIDGEFKLAQYGQWDGYPEGQGATALAFLRSADLEAFKDKLRKCRWSTDEYIAEVNATPNWPKVYPHMSRDAGAEVLQMIADSPDGLTLADQRGFAGDSLFCEWAYLIDFDKNLFVAFKGFNKTPVPSGWFPSGAPWLEHSGEYEPVMPIKAWPLDALPDEQEFIAALSPSDEDEKPETYWAEQMNKLLEQVSQ